MSDFHNYIASDMQISIMRLQEEVERLTADRDYWRKIAEERTMENEPEKTEPKTREEMTAAERMMDSITFVVDMMNEGKADPKQVYPPNRYHGD